MMKAAQLILLYHKFGLCLIMDTLWMRCSSGHSIHKCSPQLKGQAMRMPWMPSIA